MKIGISIGNSRKDKVWKYKEMELGEFVKRISSTTRTSETMEEYKKLHKARRDDIKDVGGFILGKLKDNSRRKDCVINRCALSLDMDYATPNTIDYVEKNFNFKGYFYSTHNHTKENPRLRLIIPLSRNVSPDEYSAISRKIAEEIDIEIFDDTTYEDNRLMYWPSTSYDGEFIFKEIGETFLNPDEILAKYHDWTNPMQWPVSTRQNKLLQSKIKNQEDPLEKNNLVGAFCRAYDIAKAIDSFLSDIYEEVEFNKRYSYIPATSQGGLVVYDNKFAYSHHASDPACSKLLNAFDLVRIHKYSDLDEKFAEENNSTILPSYQAMINFVLCNENVKLQLANERAKQINEDFSSISAEDDDEYSWLSSLELNKKGGIKDSLSNIASIVRHDKNLKPIVYNQFKSNLDVIGKLPWKQAKSGWNDNDFSCAKVYFEKVYSLWSPAKLKDALYGVVYSERIYHPVKEYLNTLVWDGTPRIDTLLVDYLGAEDSEYVRAVTRKTLVAAIARIYKPGIKFDSILVLNGPQGIGKSTLFSILGKSWYSDSLCLTDMKDKTAA